MSMEVITTTDKDQRDRLFEDLRKNGNELEKQVVKFSSNEPVFTSDGKPTYDGALRADGTIKAHSRGRSRQVFRSTWSVAYPNF